MIVCLLQRTRATQIIPCNVSQLMSASQAEESFKVGDVEVTQVSCNHFDLIVSVNPQEKNYMFTACSF